MIIPTPRRIRLSALAAGAALCAMTGAAYAAGVPAAASSVLHRLGIATPAPASHSGSDTTPTHGSVVSSFAKSTELAGAAKGAAIAALASGGKSHAGEHGKAGAGGSEETGTDTKAAGNGHGATISTLARTTTATGAAKGATISAAASGGRSHAGEHGGGSTGSGHGQSGDHSTHAGGNGGSGHGSGSDQAG